MYGTFTAAKNRYRGYFSVPLYNYCLDHDPSIQVRGSANAPRPPGDDTAGPPPRSTGDERTTPEPQR